MISENEALTVLDELKDYLSPQSNFEKARLEESILAEGCREPLTAFFLDGELILLDGHHRYAICKKFDIGYKVKALYHIQTLDEAKEWMLSNQFARRNLTDAQRTYYLGLYYNNSKQEKGGNQKGKEPPPISARPRVFSSLKKIKFGYKKKPGLKPGLFFTLLQIRFHHFRSHLNKRYYREYLFLRATLQPRPGLIV